MTLIIGILIFSFICLIAFICIMVIKFVRYAETLFNGGSTSQTDTDPHIHVDSRKLLRLSKKSKL